MIDMLRLLIPFGGAVSNLNIRDLLMRDAGFLDPKRPFSIPPDKLFAMAVTDGLSLSSGDVYWDVEKQNVGMAALAVRYESLPSSFSGVALKINHAPLHGLPYVEVKASPAKLLQGHNVWGWDDLLSGVAVLLDTLKTTCPTVYSVLDLKRTELRAIDINYGFKMDSHNHVMAVLDYMGNVSYGQIQADHKAAEGNTRYFGSRQSKHKFIRMYSKEVELSDKITVKKKQAVDQISDTQLEQMKDQKVVDFSKNLLRIEAAIRKVWIADTFNSLLLSDIISQWTDSICKTLWVNAMSDLVKACGDVSFKSISDQDIQDLINEHYKVEKLKIRKDGSQSVSVSYSNANNIYNFYRLVIADGFEAVKSTTAHKTFYRRLQQLEAVGISRAHLQQYKSGSQEHRTIVPFVKIVEISNATLAPHPMPDYTQLLSEGFVDHFKQVFGVDLKAG